MSHWNHRVVKHKSMIEGEPDWYAIHEAYYFEEGKPPAVTVNPKEPFGESLEELRYDLERMLRSLDKPVLDYGTREEL